MQQMYVIFKEKSFTMINCVRNMVMRILSKAYILVIINENKKTVGMHLVITN